ncbi:hypothetical protein EI94DRAFT_1707594 [Lactarius quietus]|nr:hypothetical protein EI94DRAFT_1707594 [Lactarius quietus]
MPPQHVLKTSKSKADKSVPKDTQENLLGPAAPVPSLPAGQVWHTHSCVLAKAIKDVHQNLGEGSATQLPSCPLTGQVSTALKPVANDGSSKEFELPNAISDVNCGSPQVEPTPGGGLLTPRSNPLGTATLDSDTRPSVSNIGLFFSEFRNDEGKVMRCCNACL